MAGDRFEVYIAGRLSGTAMSLDDAEEIAWTFGDEGDMVEIRDTGVDEDRCRICGQTTATPNACWQCRHEIAVSP
jgi:hypothetical protein